MTNALYILLLSSSLLIAASDTAELDKGSETATTIASSAQQDLTTGNYTQDRPNIGAEHNTQISGEQPCKYDPIAFLADHEKEAAFMCAALLILGLWIR